DGRTPMHIAISRNHHEVVGMLAGREGAANMNMHDPDLPTPLHMAVHENYAVCTEILIKAGATVDPTMRGPFTPLSLAAKNGHLAQAQMLIQAGADVNRRGEKSRCPLIEAASHGHAELAQALIDAGAECNSPPRSMSPLQFAAREGHVGVVHVLIKAGADLNFKPTSGTLTPLMLASKAGYETIVAALIQAGAEAEIRGYDSNTALHFAAFEGHSGATKALLHGGADINAPGRNQLHDTPLHMACCTGFVDVVGVLLQHGAEVDLQNGLGKTPLHTATIWGHAKIVAMLAAAGADVNLEGPRKVTALHMAGSQGRAGVAEVLLQAGADVAARNMDHDTPLCLAQKAGNGETAQVLIKAGAAVLTPSHGASQGPQPSVSVDMWEDEQYAGAKGRLQTTGSRWRGALFTSHGVNASRATGTSAGTVETTFQACAPLSSDSTREVLQLDCVGAVEARWAHNRWTAYEIDAAYSARQGGFQQGLTTFSWDEDRRRPEEALPPSR
ncbi:hypothetical protein CYMTET_12424, partial [Cymbomonas tetramitiformis]